MKASNAEGRCLQYNTSEMNLQSEGSVKRVDYREQMAGTGGYSRTGEYRYHRWIA